ncbi:MAG: HEPN domain-containing protein [Candidatus Aminicenantes bacterium]|nr:HEPN domain-containing protein [Candidatus Aminicenantes bacterium]NIM77297.1 HEPN domain-containing protein [Candidatus Aminicenantes bacterium]NIN16598.1 HEPN domain-containing protein [Candidatus Aminicenantes bacterium]NIN40456.1 HEPN domain-containing protein [Candidatus Aminicenantes bacterium]NIN83276.1 HEPN domain-containing protein [Candidatus Aminicenantes bacterium]
MSPKLKTRDVSKSLYRNYLKKAEECLHAANNSFSAHEWDSSTISAIHACISGCDAMCVYFLGKRNAGENHNDTVALFKTIKNDESINTNANRISRVLRVKNMAEYEERLVYRSEAEKVLKDCERFLEFVIKSLP